MFDAPHVGHTRHRLAVMPHWALEASSIRQLMLKACSGGEGKGTCWPLRPLWPDLGLIQVHKQGVQIQRVRQNVHPVAAGHTSDPAEHHAARKTTVLYFTPACASVTGT